MKPECHTPHELAKLNEEKKEQENAKGTKYLIRPPPTNTNFL
jgi:hypothetical protein